MTSPSTLITDGELCALLRISPKTMRRILRSGPPRVRHRNGGDLRLIQKVLVGGQRRWLKSSVDVFINNGEQS